MFWLRLIAKTNPGIHPDHAAILAGKAAAMAKKFGVLTTARILKAG